MKDIYLVLFVAVFLITCTASNTDQFDRENPESIRNFLYSDGIYSVIIAKNDEILLEEYFNGKTKDDASNIQSLTKSIMSILIGICIDEKLLLSENESIARYFPDQFQILSPEKKKITVCHILNQTSGLSWRGYREHLGWLKSQDPMLYVLTKKMNHTPGTSYLYNSGATHLLSGIVTKSSGLSSLEFAKAKLFDPLQIHPVNWEMRSDGYYDGGGFGLEMRPIDLLKIGQLLLDRGIRNDRPLVSVQWIDKLFDAGEKWSTNWGLPGSTHGFCWYHALVDNIEIHYAMGYGGQFIFLIPEKDLVVVATHNHDTTRGARQQTKFLREKFGRLIQVY